MGTDSSDDRPRVLGLELPPGMRPPMVEGLRTARRPSGPRLEVPNVLAGRQPVGRRRFLELVAGAGAGALVLPILDRSSAAATTSRAAGGSGSIDGYVVTYPEGVMCGDPLPDGAVIWTQLSPPPGGVDVEVLWEVSTTPDFAVVAAGGATTADATDAHTVHVAVTGLPADAWYHYRFTAEGVASPIGRLRTAPSASASPSGLRFAWASCQQLSSPFAAHRAMTGEGLDFFMHLGDYIYANDSGTITVPDYRSRYRQWKDEPELQELQRLVPIVSMMDDGEFYNGMDNTDEPNRLLAARQVWFEKMPVIGGGGDPLRAWRDFTWGDLAETFMIDVRSYRDPAVDEIDTSTAAGKVIFEADRTTLGLEQRAWLKAGLAASSRTWKLIGNPYNLGLWRLADTDPGPPRPVGVHAQDGTYAPNEAWDDYWAERKELLDHIATNGVENVTSFSGHTHIWIQSQLRPDWDDPTSPIVAHDFTCGSLTADPDVILQAEPATPEAAFAFYTSLQNASRRINPDQRYINFINQGYGVCEITPDEMVVEFKAMDVYDLDATPEVIARFVLRNGRTRLAMQVLPSPLIHPTVTHPTVATFTDVTTSHPFFDDIEWLSAQGVTLGYEDRTFHPGESVTRQAMAAFLARYAGTQGFTAAGTTFPDVPTTSPFWFAVEWLVGTGVADGYADGRFHPTAKVSRQAMAAFLHQLAGAPAFTPPGTASFTDVPTSHRFFAEIEWLASTTVTGGFADGGFHPTSAVSRQAMAAFLHRFDDLVGLPVT